MRDRGRWLLGAAVVVHLLVLYWPSTPSGDGTLPGLDKVVHAAVFAAVAVAGRLAGAPVLHLAVALLAHAALSEVVQHVLLPARAGDLADVAADVAGVAVGLAVPLSRPRGHDGRTR